MVFFFRTVNRLCIVLSLCGLLIACGSHGKHVDPSDISQLPAVAGEPDFNWRLSGDRRVAPKQVFSDEQRVWLQWPHRKSLPTIFGRIDDTWEVLHPQKVGAYVLIKGDWKALKFQGGAVKALAQKIGFEYVPHQAIHSGSRSNQLRSALSQQQLDRILSNLAALNQASTDQSLFDQTSPRHGSLNQTKRVQTTSNQLITHGVQTKKFKAELSDKTIRQAVKRWAHQTKWHFENVHWAVNVDLPISAAAEFTDDFVTSVQQLLVTTEMSDKPVQPCFYTNHVVRIVPIAQVCDPQARRGPSV